MDDIRYEIRKIINEYALFEGNDVMFLSSFESVVVYFEKKIPLIKYYNKDDFFLKQDVVKYNIYGDKFKRNIMYQGRVLKYECQPFSTVSLSWYKDRNLRTEIKNEILYNTVENHDDFDAKHDLSKAIHDNMDKYCFTKFIRYDPDQLSFLKLEFDKSIDEVNKRMMVFDDYLAQRFGKTLI